MLSSVGGVLGQGWTAATPPAGGSPPTTGCSCWRRRHNPALPRCPRAAGKLEFKCDQSTGRPTCQCVSTGIVGCFPGAARVSTPGGGSAALSDLALGDRVLAVGPGGHLHYTPIVMFSSRRPSQLAQFVRIHTDAGRNITCGCRQPASRAPRRPAALPCRRAACPAHHLFGFLTCCRQQSLHARHTRADAKRASPAAAVTPGHYLFAWSGAGGAAVAAAAEAALGCPASWPYVLPTQVGG